MRTRFEKCFDDYLGSHYSDYWYFQVAEFLDPRAHFYIAPDKLKSVIGQMKPMCLSAELQNVSTTNNRSTLELSEREKIRQSLVGKTTKSMFETECGRFMQTLELPENKNMCPLTFWGSHGSMFPILSRIAARILPTAACSTDAERLFSISGKICSPDRSALGSKMIDMLTVMYYWLTDDFLQMCMNEKVRTAKHSRFARLDHDMEVQIGSHYHPYVSDNEDDSM